MRKKTRKYIDYAIERMDAARKARIDLAKKLDSIGLKSADVMRVLDEYAAAEADLEKAFAKLGRQTFEDEENMEVYEMSPPSHSGPRS